MQMVDLSHFYKGNNFWDFLFAFLHKVPSEKGYAFKGKNFLPMVENSFLLE